MGGTNRSLSEAGIRTTIITSQRKESLTESRRWVGGEKISTDEGWVPTLTITVASEEAESCCIWFDGLDLRGSTSRGISWITTPLSPSELVDRMEEQKDSCSRRRWRQRTRCQRHSQAVPVCDAFKTSACRRSSTATRLSPPARLSSWNPSLLRCNRVFPPPRHQSLYQFPLI